jgi:hypothetical protein
MGVSVRIGVFMWAHEMRKLGSWWMGTDNGVEKVGGLGEEVSSRMSGRWRGWLGYVIQPEMETCSPRRDCW